MTEEALKVRWLADMRQSLIQARKMAGLTQAQVAQRMGTKQSVVARLEKDTQGRMSFRTFVRYAQACGMGARSLVPLSISLIPIEWARLFYEENPHVPLTHRNLLAWNAARIRHGANALLDPKEWQIDF